MFRLSFRYLFRSAVLVLACASTGCAIPAWYTNTGSIDAASDGPAYFYGRGSADIEDGKKAEALAKAKQSAIHDACSMVSCTVNGQTERYQEETDSALVDAFVSRTTIDTAVEAARVKVFKQETDRRRAYVMVGIDRDGLRNSYRERIRKGFEDAKGDFSLAEELAKENPRRSLIKYRDCMTVLRSLDDDLKVYLILNGWNNDLGDPQKVVPRKKVERRLGELADSIPQRTDELAGQLASELVKGRNKGASFAIYPIEYENTGFVSGFGIRLTELLAASLSRHRGWRRVEALNEADCVVRGKLLVSGSGMNILLTCKGPESEHVAQSYASPRTCKQIGWGSIKPRDLDQALADKLALHRELKSDASLRVELQTDKLTDGPVVYRYGERPKLALKANRACYVRLMYIFSDGIKVLLLDNYRIANDMANEWKRLPVNWEVCAPPGVEQMLVQATVGEKMPQLDVKRRDLPGGYYQDIIRGELAESVMLTRGGMSFDEDPVITEVPYQWTIFEK